jgi:prepilin-type N-terminal cleavage/methylation domain-containing protein
MVHRVAARGFTLIEMLLVVSIFGFMVLIAAPKIDLQKFSVESAMQSTGTTLLVAQRFAVTRQHNIIVVLDTSAQALRILDDANNNGKADAGEHLRVVPLNDHIVFGLGGAPPLGSWVGPVSFTKQFGNLPAVTFHRDGSASEGGAIYLTTARAARDPTHAGDTRVIEIERATARVSWYRAAPPSWRRGF